MGSEMCIRDRLSACKIVQNPQSADAFIVPAFLATAIVAGWNGERNPVYASWLQLLGSEHINGSLHYLTAETARRHVFLCSVDSQFVYLGASRGRGAALRPGVEQQSIWVHLGDDHYTTATQGMAPRAPVERYGYHIPNGLIVPYRISQWLPFGNPPSRVEHKSLLLFATLNPRKHAIRRQLAQSLRNQSERLGLGANRVMVHAASERMLSTAVAAKGAMRARFCRTRPAQDCKLKCTLICRVPPSEPKECSVARCRSLSDWRFEGPHRTLLLLHCTRMHTRARRWLRPRPPF